MTTTQNSTAGISAGKKWAFRGLLVLMPLVLLMTAEGVVRIALASPDSDDPFINIGAIPEFYEQVMIDGVAHYRISHSQAYRGRNITFPVHKDPDTFRIFCLGGSASAGWPHPVSEIYSSYLQRALERAYPGRRFEVINSSAHAYASYRVRMIFDNVMKFDPDLVVIYSGNNEFLERRTYDVGGRALARVAKRSRRLRVVRLLEYAWKRFRNPGGSLSGLSREHINYEMWTKIAGVALQLREDPGQYEKLKDHYRYNVESMVKRAGERDIPVVLLTVPVNLRDWHPNVSVNRLEGDALETWRTHYYAGRRGLLTGDAETAVAGFLKSLELDPGVADAWYYLGRAYEEAGRHAEAREAYTRARDLDHNPFRAVSEFNETVRMLADEFPNAFLADTERAFMDASAPYVPGFNLFLDYVHPRKEGNILIARTVFGAIADAGLLGADAASGFTAIPSPPADGLDAYDYETDYKMQETLVHLFAMMRQYENMYWKASKYTGPEYPRLERMERAMSVVPDLLELERRRIMGEPVTEAEETAMRDRVRAYYHDEFPKLKWVDDLTF